VDKIIVTALLILAGAVSAVILFGVVNPAVGQSGAAMASLADNVSERITSQIEIIHATGELDGDGVWQDTNSDGYFNVFIWAKNVGSSRILGIHECDLFFGQEGDFSRIPHVNDAGGGLPAWIWAIENDTEWGPTATVKLTIYFSSALSAGRYYLKVVIPNGISDECTITM
jgi:hypothetical protein